MRYLCVHCDHRFEHEGGDGGEKPRCPKCMRRHGLEELRTPASGSGGGARPRWLIPAAVGLLVAGVVVGYVVWSGGTDAPVAAETPLRPLEHGELLSYVRAEDVELDDLVNFLVPSEAIESFAEGAVADASESMDKAEALVAAIRERASEGAFVSWSLSMPRQTPLRSVARVAELIDDEDGQHRLYPLEVAAFAVSALRTQDVPAMVAEVYSFPGDRAPADPSGKLGYFVVAVYPGDPGEGTPRLLDPFSGRNNAPEEGEFRVLSDTQVLAAALNHLAVYRLVHEGDDRQASSLSSRALRLDGRSPVLRTSRGMIHIAQMNNQEALEEWEAAFELRADSPRRKYMAAVYLELASTPAGSTADLERARSELASALDNHPDYADAHALMAAIQMADYVMSPAESHMRDARASLEAAERLDPELPDLPLLWANFYLQMRDMEQAAAAARQAIERARHNWRTRLVGARILREAGYYGEMREQARAIMELVPARERTGVRQLIEAALGPTALEDPDAIADAEEENEDDLDLELPGGESFQLGQDSRLLGGESAPIPPGSLTMEGTEPLLNLGDPSMLRLRDPHEGLQLNLDLE